MGLAQQLQHLRRESGRTAAQLGGEMGCSAKEVAAWEAGHTMPDAERLLELCRLLEVELPELLDVTGDPALPTAPLTADQLRAVEQLLNARQQSDRRPGRLALAALCGGLVLLLALALGQGGKLGALQEQNRLLQTRLTTLEQGLTNRVDELDTQLRAGLLEQGMLALEWDYELRGIDRAKGELRLRLSALPRKLAEGERLVFVAEGADFAARAAEGTLDADGLHSVAELTLPLSDDIALTLQRVGRAGRENERLGSLTGLASAAQTDGGGSYSGSIEAKDGQAVLEGRVEATLFGETGGLLEVTPVTAALLLGRGEDVVAELPGGLPPTEPARSDEPRDGLLGGAERSWALRIPVRQSLDCAPGEQVWLALAVSDGAGPMRRIPVAVWQMEADGSLTELER